MIGILGGMGTQAGLDLCNKLSIGNPVHDKKPKYPYRIAILMAILTIPPIGATQLGWYLFDQQTGFDYGMIVGTFSVIYAAWLMYEKKWREEDED